MLAIDKYAYCSRLTAANAYEKLAFALLTMLICLAANEPLISTVIVFLMLAVTSFYGGIPLTYYLKLLLLPAGFAVMAILPIAITAVPNREAAEIILLIGSSSYGITTSSILTAAALILKALAAVSCLYFLALSTPMVDLLAVLRSLKVPVLFLELMMLIYRFVFLLLETAETMFVAQTSRLGYKNVTTGFRSLGQLITNLFIRAYKQANDLYTALDARCYHGELRVLMPRREVSGKHICAIITIETILVVLALFLGGHF